MQYSISVADAAGIPAIGSTELKQQLHRIKVPVFNGANQRLVNDLIPVAAYTNIGAPIGEDANGAQVTSAGSQHHRRLMCDGKVCVSAEAT